MEGKWNCKRCSGSGWKNVAPEGEDRRVRRCGCIHEIEAEEAERRRISDWIIMAKMEECRRRGLSILFDLDKVEAHAAHEACQLKMM